MSAIFVFGSNLAGIHGAGAAAAALTWGAQMGQGIGRQGQTYAIPTKDREFKTLPLAIIRTHVRDFLDYAKQYPDDQFLVTAVGTGYAGILPEVMADMFAFAPTNVTLPEGWREMTTTTAWASTS